MDLGILKWVTGLRTPALDFVFYHITNLGSENFYLIVLTFIFWCVSKRFGYAMGQIVVLTNMLNTGIKEVFRIGRPIDKWPGEVGPGGIEVMHPETGPGYGFPSGHSQGTATFWGFLATGVKRRWFTILAVVIVALIGISRVYLAVHSPSDVLAGWFVGLLLVLGFNLLRAAWGRHVHLSFGWNMALAVILPLALLPLSFNIDGFKMVGLLVGVSVGWLLEERYVRFDVRATAVKHLLKLVIGVGGVMLIRLGLKPVLHAVIPAVGFLARPIPTTGVDEAVTLAGGIADMLRYGLMGFYGICLAPLLFRALRLSGRSTEDGEPTLLT